MQFKFTLITTIALISLAPTARAVCCIYGSPPDACGLIAEDPTSRIYNSDVFVPEEGAVNVFTGAELSSLGPDIDVCCCRAANNLACRTVVSSLGASLLTSRSDGIIP